MKKLFILVLIMSALISCRKNEEDIALYHVKFQLKKADSNTNEVHFIQENPQKIRGNGIKNSDSVAVGFSITESFPSPSNKEVTQQFTFHLSMRIPGEEFTTDSGVYKFKNASSFENYIPSGNLFENRTLLISTFFHEDMLTFCSAQLDQNFNNNFEITRTSYYTDDNGNDAMDIEGVFSIRYNSICSNGDIKLEGGSFRVKLLIDEIP